MPAGLEPLSDASGEATEQELNIGDAAWPRLSIYICKCGLSRSLRVCILEVHLIGKNGFLFPSPWSSLIVTRCLKDKIV